MATVYRSSRSSWRSQEGYRGGTVGEPVGRSSDTTIPDDRRNDPRLSTSPGLILVEPERFLERGEDFVPVGRVVPAIHPPEIAQRLLDPCR